VLDIIGSLRNGHRPPGEPQDIRQRHYHRLPTAAEFQAFHDKGFRLVAYPDYESLLEHYGAPLPDRPGGPGSAASARLHA